MRIREIDIAKGVAMLLVMLGHSPIEFPINLAAEYPWCKWLLDVIYSFHMPLFFLLSGFLYNGGGDKPSSVIIKKRFIKLFVPYIFITMIVVATKVLSPVSMATTDAPTGMWGYLWFIFVDCGNRWFVYVLFLIFCIAVLLRKSMRKMPFDVLLIAVCFGVIISGVTQANVIDYIARFLIFFIIGGYVRRYYTQYERLMGNRIFAVISVLLFLLFNVVMIESVSEYPLMHYVILPLIGSNVVWMGCHALRGCKENVVMKGIDYIGRYSIQFYLLLFPVAVLRYFICQVCHISDPLVIVPFMFVGQIVSIALLVEITRRIPILKYPLGYV